MKANTVTSPRETVAKCGICFKDGMRIIGYLGAIPVCSDCLGEGKVPADSLSATA